MLDADLNLEKIGSEYQRIIDETSIKDAISSAQQTPAVLVSPSKRQRMSS